MIDTSINLEDTGRELYELISELYPIHRSITGPGVRKTLDVLKKYIPLQVHEVTTGTQAFDWQVPKEWRIRDAYVKDQMGTRVIDYRDSNLHVVSYSVPVRETITWQGLKSHLFTVPEYPDWIPYRTSHFQESWGFCLSHNHFLDLEKRGNADYEVCIDSVLVDGSLTYGELVLPGEVSDEVLISCHICHPSLANDNLSGIAVATYLARYLGSRDRRYSYRFIFIPATIGAITWLSVNESHLTTIKHGLILTLLGDPGKSTYKKSRQGDAEIDRAVIHVLRLSNAAYAVKDFEPFGYDERQFCSPGIDLPVGCLMRTPHGEYPQYHTSADNLAFVKPRYLADSCAKCLAVIDVLENNRTYLNQNPKCEPQLGKKGLYHAFGYEQDKRVLQQALLWVLNLSDGKHTLLDIADRASLGFNVVKRAANTLSQHGLLKEYTGSQ